jgi:hypothetical protein
MLLVRLGQFKNPMTSPGNLFIIILKQVVRLVTIVLQTIDEFI